VANGVEVGCALSFDWRGITVHGFMGQDLGRG